MKLEGNNTVDKLAFVQDLFSTAQGCFSAQKIKFDEYDEQYRGGNTIYPKGQAPAQKATDVYNISFELVEGSIDTEQPRPKVTPSLKCEHNIRNARRIENLLKFIRDKQPYELNLDMEERIVKIFSAVGTNIEWDVDAVSHSTVGEVKSTTIMPHNIFPQPGIKNVDDCDYIFVNYITTRSAIMRKYNKSEQDVEGTEFDPSISFTFDQDSGKIADQDIVTLTIMWYRNDEGNICRFVYSGDLVLEDDDDYYSRKVEYCVCCSRRRELCELDPCQDPNYERRTLDYDELVEDVVCSDGRVIPAMSPLYKNGQMVLEKKAIPVTRPDGSSVMERIGGVSVPAVIQIDLPKMVPTRLPYYKPKKFPINIRYNIKDYNSFWGISDMEIIKPQQQTCNKLTSRINDAVQRAGAALFKPEDADVTFDNGVFTNIIELKENMDKNQFGMFAYSVDISPWLRERAEQKEQAKMLLGISNSYLGQADTTAKSGFAKSVQIQQSQGRLASKRMMKYASYADRDRAIFELYLAFADEPRDIYHEDDDCKLAMSDRFCRYDFYEYDAKTGNWYIDDEYAFGVNLDIALESQKPQLWEIIKSDYAAGMYGDPADPATRLMAWRHLEQLNYPNARNVVESIKQHIEMIRQSKTNYSNNQTDPSNNTGMKAGNELNNTSKGGLE